MSLTISGGQKEQIDSLYSLRYGIVDMKTKLNVSSGTRLNFAANGNPVSGIIVDSKQTPGLWASVAVETSDTIPPDAHLTIPDLPAAGGCGSANPVQRGTRTVVVLSIGYSHTDTATI